MQDYLNVWIVLPAPTAQATQEPQAAQFVQRVLGVLPALSVAQLAGQENIWMRIRHVAHAQPAPSAFNGLQIAPRVCRDPEVMQVPKSVYNALLGVLSHNQKACAKTVPEDASAVWDPHPVQSAHLVTAVWLCQKVAFHVQLDVMFLTLQCLVLFAMLELLALVELRAVLHAKQEDIVKLVQAFAKTVQAEGSVKMLLPRALIVQLVHLAARGQRNANHVHLVHGVLLGPRNVNLVMLENLWFPLLTLPVKHALRERQAHEAHHSVSHVKVVSTVLQVRKNALPVHLANSQLMRFNAWIALLELGVALHQRVARHACQVQEVMPQLVLVKRALLAHLWCSQIGLVKYVLLAPLATLVLFFVKTAKLAPSATNPQTSAWIVLQEQTAAWLHFLALTAPVEDIA